MSTHVEKRNNEYVVVDNKTGKVIAGPFGFRETAYNEIRKRERERKEQGERYLTRI